VIVDQEPARAGKGSCPIRTEQFLHVAAVLYGIDRRVVHHVDTEAAGYSPGGCVQLRRIGCIPLQRLNGRS
jgi:hypothetical protein